MRRFCLALLLVCVWLGPAAGDGQRKCFCPDSEAGRDCDAACARSDMQAGIAGPPLRLRERAAPAGSVSPARSSAPPSLAPSPSLAAPPAAEESRDHQELQAFRISLERERARAEAERREIERQREAGKVSLEQYDRALVQYQEAIQRYDQGMALYRAYIRRVK